MGARTTKTLVREDDTLQEFKELTGNMRNTSVRAVVISSIYMPIVMALGSIGTGLALWFGGEGVISQTLSYGTLLPLYPMRHSFLNPFSN